MQCALRSYDHRRLARNMQCLFVTGSNEVRQHAPSSRANPGRHEKRGATVQVLAGSLGRPAVGPTCTARCGVVHAIRAARVHGRHAVSPPIIATGRMVTQRTRRVASEPLTALVGRRRMQARLCRGVDDAQEVGWWRRAGGRPGDGAGDHGAALPRAGGGRFVPARRRVSAARGSGGCMRWRGTARRPANIYGLRSAPRGEVPRLTGRANAGWFKPSLDQGGRQWSRARPSRAR